MNGTPARRLLIAEDDAGFRETLALEFGELGFDVSAVSSIKELEALERRSFDFAVVDLKLGTDNGLRVIDAIRRASPACRIVVLTGYASIATAVQATKLGAIDYLMKPASVAKILGVLTSDSVGADFAQVDAPPPSLARAEREYIETVMANCHGNISKAAALLGVHRQSLQRKLRKFTPRQ
jgi:two-component system response regulator RegA